MRIRHVKFAQSVAFSGSVYMSLNVDKPEWQKKELTLQLKGDWLYCKVGDREGEIVMVPYTNTAYIAPYDMDQGNLAMNRGGKK